jgi:hypothetical protein
MSFKCNGQHTKEYIYEYMSIYLERAFHDGSNKINNKKDEITFFGNFYPWNEKNLENERKVYHIIYSSLPVPDPFTERFLLAYFFYQPRLISRYYINN